MDSSVQVFSNTEFSVRTTRDADGTVWFVGKDIAEALDYSEMSNPARLFSNVPEQWKGVKQIHTPGGVQEMLCLTEQGVYFFLGRSDKPKALPYQMWIAGEVMPSIMHTGGYSTGINTDELKLRREELARKDEELSIRKAELLQSMIGLCPMTEETKTVFIHEAYKALTGNQLLSMLPESTEKWYTAGEIGELLGISANKVGRIAKEYGIKAPEGESNKYGRWVFTKSRYSNHECSSFIYNAYALEHIRHILKQAG